MGKGRSPKQEVGLLLENGGTDAEVANNNYVLTVSLEF